MQTSPLQMLKSKVNAKQLQGVGYEPSGPSSRGFFFAQVNGNFRQHLRSKQPQSLTISRKLWMKQLKKPIPIITINVHPG
jgi:hypothetical protein